APGGHEALRVLPIEVEALPLPVARRRRSLVPVQLQPAQGVEDRVEVVVGGARLVGVLDAEDEPPPVVARVEPVEKRGALAADVEVTGRAGREAHANLLAHWGHVGAPCSIRLEEPAPSRARERADARAA